VSPFDTEKCGREGDERLPKLRVENRICVDENAARADGTTGLGPTLQTKS
jgi:hypothetical protein